MYIYQTWGQILLKVFKYKYKYFLKYFNTNTNTYFPMYLNTNTNTFGKYLNTNTNTLYKLNVDMGVEILISSRMTSEISGYIEYNYTTEHI